MLVVVCGCDRVLGIGRITPLVDSGPGGTQGDAAPDAIDAVWPDCPAIYDQGGGRYRIDSNPAAALEWTFAEQACEADGAQIKKHTHLLVLDDTAEVQTIKSLPIPSASWIGITDIKTVKTWLPVTDQTTFALPWAPSYPANFNQCVELQQGGTIINVTCTETHDFICECDDNPVDPTHF